jgi:uncharacterized membrane protein YfcA
MSIAGALVTFLFGSVVGIVAGLVGIGGGVLNVPFLYVLFDAGSWTGIRIAPEHRTVVAHATSLAVVVPTALSGAWIHHRGERIAWAAAIPMALGALLSAPLGARAALHLDPALLRFVFGIVLSLAGLRLLVSAMPFSGGARVSEGVRGPGDLRSRRIAALLLGLGLLQGGFAALMGIGGAILTIPVLIFILRLDMAYVAGTALVVTLAAALSGTFAFALEGALRDGISEMTIGFVFLPAVVFLVPGAVAMARIGARLNHRVDAIGLRWLFGLLLLLAGLRLAVQNLGQVLPGGWAPGAGP